MPSHHVNFVRFAHPTCKSLRASHAIQAAVKQQGHSLEAAVHVVGYDQWGPGDIVSSSTGSEGTRLNCEQTLDEHHPTMATVLRQLPSNARLYLPAGTVGYSFHWHSCRSNACWAAADPGMFQQQSR